MAPFGFATSDRHSAAQSAALSSLTAGPWVSALQAGSGPFKGWKLDHLKVRFHDNFDNYERQPLGGLDRKANKTAPSQK